MGEHIRRDVHGMLLLFEREVEHADSNALNTSTVHMQSQNRAQSIKEIIGTHLSGREVFT